MGGEKRYDAGRVYCRTREGLAGWKRRGRKGRIKYRVKFTSFTGERGIKAKENRRDLSA